MNLLKCPYCGEMVPSAKFCIKCGKELEIDASGASDHQQLITCHHCGKNVPKTKWCIFCGKSLEKIPLTELPQATEMIECPLCRNEVPSSHNFCHLCGGKLKKITVNDQEQSILCNRCWKPNPPDTGYCIHCGLQRQVKKSLFLEKPFEGYQLSLSQFFQPSMLPLSTLKFSLTSSKKFPNRVTISHSKFFGVTKSRKGSVLFRNFGGFDGNNLLNYLGSFILIFLIYIFWFSGRYSNLVEQYNPITDGILTSFFGGILLTALLMLPIWLSTLLVYRNTGYRLNYRIDSSRVFITVIFNVIWLFVGFGPILLQIGDFKNPRERFLVQKSFIKGIVWGTVFTVCFTLLLALLSIATAGFPGVFSGFLFQNHPIKSHLLASYFGATWISLVLILPFGDYFDKVIKHWSQLGYFILLAIGFLLLTHSFNLMGLLYQITYRA